MKGWTEMNKWIAALLLAFAFVSSPATAEDSVIAVFGNADDVEVTAHVEESSVPGPATSVARGPDPAPVPAQVSKPAESALPGGVRLVSPSPDAVLLDQVSREINQVGSQVRLLELQVQKRGLEERLGNTTSSGTPELIGIFGSPASLRAEFRVGKAVLVAKAGEWVTDRWRVVRVMGNGAVLTDGSTQQTVLFGRGGGQASASASRDTSPRPMPEPPRYNDPAPYVAPNLAQGAGDD